MSENFARTFVGFFLHVYLFICIHQGWIKVHAPLHESICNLTRSKLALSASEYVTTRQGLKWMTRWREAFTVEFFGSKCPRFHERELLIMLEPRSVSVEAGAGDGVTVTAHFWSPLKLSDRLFETVCQHVHYMVSLVLTKLTPEQNSCSGRYVCNKKSN